MVLLMDIGTYSLEGTNSCRRRVRRPQKKSSGTKVQPEDDGGVESLETWQERAVQRRLSGARARALARSSRFLATALELMQDSGGRADFTVQDLIDRSNLSLRAFYQHFAGKEELLLALYENVQSQFIEDIRQEVSAADGPLGQLEAFFAGGAFCLGRSRPRLSVAGSSRCTTSASRLRGPPISKKSVGAPPPEAAQANIDVLLARGPRSQGPVDCAADCPHDATLTSLGQFSMLHTGPNVELTLDDIWAWCRQSVAAPVGAATSKPSPARRRTAAAPKTTRASRR